MNADAQVDDLLRESGAVLLRSRKHEVWLLPNGNKFTRSKTPSDHRARRNDLSDLRRALGIRNEGRGEGERREKAHRPKQRPAREFFEKTVNTGLADALKLAGVSEDALREELEWAQSEVSCLKAELAEAAVEIEQLKARECGCLWCRLTRRLRGVGGRTPVLTGKGRAGRPFEG